MPSASALFATRRRARASDTKSSSCVRCCAPRRAPRCWSVRPLWRGRGRIQPVRRPQSHVRDSSGQAAREAQGGRYVHPVRRTTEAVREGVVRGVRSGRAQARGRQVPRLRRARGAWQIALSSAPVAGPGALPRAACIGPLRTMRRRQRWKASRCVSAAARWLHARRPGDVARPSPGPRWRAANAPHAPHAPPRRAFLRIACHVVSRGVTQAPYRDRPGSNAREGSCTVWADRHVSA